jgi:ABC-type proline/glycine betaine transport system permease subunit
MSYVLWGALITALNICVAFAYNEVVRDRSTGLKNIVRLLILIPPLAILMSLLHIIGDLIYRLVNLIDKILKYYLK